MPALFVERLVLTDFRCYRRLALAVDPRPVTLTGPNGAGKTNVLEGLSFLAPGRGLRRARLEDVARQGGPGGWGVAATVRTPAGAVEIGTAFRADGAGRRLVKLDGNAVSGPAALAETLHVSWLTPAMDRLFIDGTAGRRRFLDRLVAGFDNGHTARLAAYEHALRERSRLLREGGGDPAWLAALERTMSEEGVAVAASRRSVTARLNAALAIGVGSFPQADLAVRGEVEAWLDDAPALATEERFRARLAAERDRDAAVGGASCGPHRSDLAVRHVGKGAAAALCSTGEQKALLIAIVLAEARLHAAQRGRPPVLLLDEVAAHLDPERRAALYEEILGLGVQAWLTGTEPSLFAPLGEWAQHFRIVDGRLAGAGGAE